MEDGLFTCTQSPSSIARSKKKNLDSIMRVDHLESDGIQRIIQATCTPYTTDATSPGTIVTTPTGAFTGGASSFRSQINAWLRSVVGQSNKPDVIFEFADVLESSRDSGLWQSPPTNTADGLHPSATGATTAGNALTSLL